MFTAAKPIESAQEAPHGGLLDRLQRHLLRLPTAPVAAHTQAAFEALQRDLGPSPGGLIFDSGCGTGESTRNLAERHPEAWVVGVDKSADRLGRHRAALPANARLLRAELGDFWRCAVAAGWRLKAHYLPYPNPWPKARHYKRRWPAHPAFPWLLGLGGELEVRSNWRLYLEEWQVVLESLGIASRLSPLAPTPEAPLSPFEAKYLASGHACYALRAALGAGGVPAPSWSAYQARCEAPEVFSRPALTAILATLPPEHGQREALAEALTQALAAAPLRKPAGHRGGKASDFLPCDLGPGGSEALRHTLERVLEQRGEGGDDPALRLALRALRSR
ncbi:MAG: tRNA (guanine(46)-N(7))-methyltransferase TrmB [Pseudomonadales bacterium]